MEFKEFRNSQQKHIEDMIEDQTVLFISDVDKDTMWETYLNSFPPGANEVFRKRREFDCSCCRHFIKSFGNVVAIKDNRIVTIWDFEVADQKYNTMLKAMSSLIKSHPIRDALVTKDNAFGTDHSMERSEDKTVRTWDHFYIKLPSRFVFKSPTTVASEMGSLRDVKNVFKRSLTEITEEATETVLDLIAQKSLYKGEEWQSVIVAFSKLRAEYANLPSEEEDNFCWTKSVEAGGAVGKIRNHSIGVLLTDISNGMDLNEAVKRYEKIVAPSNYKRPKAIFSKKMIEQAQKTITELGFLSSLGRRFANIRDITVNNVLFANKDSLKNMTGDVFADLRKDAISAKKNFDKVEEVQIETFMNDVLPNVSNIEVLFENKHTSNLVSLIAPKDPGSKTMFKWNNGFSWAYNGNITDSMKERVKSMGGRVEGVLRFSIQWNEDGDNQNDFDAHCIEPVGGSHISFQNKGMVHKSSGMLDVDIIHPKQDINNGVAVENIIYTNLHQMPHGNYDLFVHVYSYRSGRSGFSAEVEFDGQIYSFEYRKDVKWTEKIHIATVRRDENGLSMFKCMDSSISSKTLWNLSTNQFHPVTVMMYSPNYWDNQNGIGHRHYFFMLNECRNSDRPNGFFNEFLKEDLMKHKRVFEALGSKMRVEDSDDQLSGLGFSSTKHNSIVCKLEGNFSRMVKINF